MALVLSVRAPLTSGLAHGLPFAVSVPALVSKSRGLAPLIRDTGTATLGTIDSQWDGGDSVPHYTGTYAANSMGLRAPGYDPWSQGIGTPNPYVTAFYAAVNYDGTTQNQNWVQSLHWKFQIPSTIQGGDSCCIYMRWHERNDPSTNLGISYSHGSGYNNKHFGYGPGGYGTIIPGQTSPQSWISALANSGNAHPITSITWSGGVATVTTAAAIPAVNVGDSFCTVIAGVSPAGYNTTSANGFGNGGASNCTVIASNQFTYALTTNPGSTGSGGTYNDPAFSHLSTNVQLHVADNLSGPSSPGSVMEVPDANGVSTYWRNQLCGYNPANGWIQKEVELCIDTRLHANGGKGYFNYIVNGNRAAGHTGVSTGPIVFYNGRTDNFMAIDPVNRAIDVGPGMYNNAAQDPHTIAYMGDFYCDISAGGVSGQCGRLVAGDAATYAACQFIEPQVIVSMSQTAGKTTIGGMFWKGRLASGSTAYWYYIDESGTVYSCGSAVVV